jgi:hypothetical protein
MFARRSATRSPFSLPSAADGCHVGLALGAVLLRLGRRPLALERRDRGDSPAAPRAALRSSAFSLASASDARWRARSSSAEAAATLPSPRTARSSSASSR